MHRVYDFWWNRTNHPKSITETASKDFDMPGIVDWIDELVDWVAAALRWVSLMLILISTGCGLISGQR